MRLPEFISFDPRVTKSFNLGERLKLQLFGEAFNLFNRANIVGVTATQYSRSTSAATCGTGVSECLLFSSTFKRPTATGPFPQGPRILQISAKVSF
jgi:hypothetical protein